MRSFPIHDLNLHLNSSERMPSCRRRIEKWSLIMDAKAQYTNYKPSTDTIFALELCISDERKPLLLANHVFVPYLVSALMLRPDHPRAAMKDDQKIWCQEYHAGTSHGTSTW